MFIIKKLKLNMRKLKGAYHGKVNLLENQEQSIKWVPLWDCYRGWNLVDTLAERLADTDNRSRFTERWVILQHLRNGVGGV
jgi:hypothetical protein